MRRTRDFNSRRILEEPNRYESTTRLRGIRGESMDPRENPGIQQSRLNGLQQFGVRIPPARFLDIPERLFPPKWFQEDGGVAGFPKEQRNR